MAENFLSQEEVDDLLKGVTGDTDSDAKVTDQSAIRPYNLATQERIVRGRMPTLELINERFARGLRVGLYNYLRRSAEVTASPVKVTKYSEFIRNLVVPTSLNLITMKPLRGSALVVLDPNLVFAMIDILFGGDGRFHTRVEGRDFTPTEQQIIKRVLEIIFEQYSKAWDPVHPVNFEYVRSEINTQFINIATPNEVVVTTLLKVEIGNVSAEMHICMPYSVIEPIRDVLTSSLQGESLDQDNRWIKRMTQQIQTAEVELVANIGTAKTTFENLLKLKVGDVIPLSVSDLVTATVDSVPVFECAYGKKDGQYALKVVNVIANNGQDSRSGD
jgi:flagellar motor switch protein FliM